MSKATIKIKFPNGEIRKFTGQEKKLREDAELLRARGATVCWWNEELGAWVEEATNG